MILRVADAVSIVGLVKMDRNQRGPRVFLDVVISSRISRKPIF